jgi:hypothetical protein
MISQCYQVRVPVRRGRVGQHHVREVSFFSFSHIFIISTSLRVATPIMRVNRAACLITSGHAHYARQQSSLS